MKNNKTPAQMQNDIMQFPSQEAENLDVVKKIMSQGNFLVYLTDEEEGWILFKETNQDILSMEEEEFDDWFDENKIISPDDCDVPLAPILELARVYNFRIIDSN